MNGDPAKLRQIFLNLLSNAIKFTDEGGTVSVDVTASDAAIAVSVADTGIGMDPEDVEIAFQPFGQVDNRLERRYEGTGLGLPLTKALVDLHRGDIIIESARGRGTRVIVTLPVAQPKNWRRPSRLFCLPRTAPQRALVRSGWRVQTQPGQQ